MKLNNERNIRLAEQEIHSMELKYSVELMAIRSKLEDTIGKDTDFDKSFTKVLREMIRYGNDPAADLSHILSSYTEKQIDLLKEYVKNYKTYNSFKTAEEKLSSSYRISKGDGHHMNIDPKGIKEFHRYMHITSPETRQINNELLHNTPTIIGHQYYMRDVQALRVIERIDPTFVPADMKKKISEVSNRPRIHGYKIPSRTNEFEETIAIDMAEGKDNKYNKAPTTLDKLSNKAYQGAQKLGKKFKSLRGPITKMLATGTLVLGITLAGIGIHNTIQNAQEFGDLSIPVQVEQLSNYGYDYHISDNTLAEMQRIDGLITACENSGTLPTNEQLREIRNLLDINTSDIISDLVTNAYEETGKGYTDIEVTNRYQLNHSSVPEPEYFIDVTYKDKDGKEHRDSISDFSTPMFTHNVLNQSYDDEYLMDTTSYYDSEGATYSELAESRQSDLAELRQILNNNRHLAAVELHLHNGIPVFGNRSLSASVPDRVETNNQTTSAQSTNTEEQPTIDDGDER